MSSARSTSAPPPSIPSNKRALRDQLQACDAAGLGASVRSVLAALWTFTDSEGGRAWPSQRRLASLTGLSERTVRTAVKRLESARLVARDVPALRDRRRVRRTTTYQLQNASPLARLAPLVEPSPELSAAVARLAALVEPSAPPSPELTRALQAPALVAPQVEPVAVAPDNQAPAALVEPERAPDQPELTPQASPELHATDQRAPAPLVEPSPPAVDFAADSDGPELTYSDGLEPVGFEAPASEVLSAPSSPALVALVEPVAEDRPHPPGNARSVEPSAPAAITGNRFRQRDQREIPEGGRARAETVPPADTSPDQSEPAVDLAAALVEPVAEDQRTAAAAPSRPGRPAPSSAPWSPDRTRPTRPPRALRAAASAPLAPDGAEGTPPARAGSSRAASAARLAAAVARLAALVASPGSGMGHDGSRRVTGAMDDNGRQWASARPPCTDRPVGTHPPAVTALAALRAALVAPAPQVEPSPPERTAEDQPELTRALVARPNPSASPERTRDTSPDTDTSAPDGSGRDIDSVSERDH